MTDNPKFSLDIERLSHITVLKLHGRLDGTTVVTLDHAIADLLNARKKTLVLDCEQLTYISSAGLRSVLLATRQVQQAGGRTLFCSIPDSIATVFEISGFTDILERSTTRAHALRELN